MSDDTAHHGHAEHSGNTAHTADPAHAAHAARTAHAADPAHAAHAARTAHAAHTTTSGEVLTAVVITCSDSAAAGLAADTSGPLAVELLQILGHSVVEPVVVVPDEVDRIASAVRSAIAGGARIVVTTGGTGPGPRDVTPEALAGMGLRELPGLGEAMRATVRDRVPAADLSRGLGGIVDRTVVLALPGSPGGVRDGLAAVGGLLGHAAAAADGAGHATHRRAPSRAVASAPASASAPPPASVPAPGPAPAPNSLADRRSWDDEPASSGEGEGRGGAGGAGVGQGSGVGLGSVGCRSAHDQSTMTWAR